MPMILGRETGAVGYGMIPLTPHAPPIPSEEQAFQVLRTAVTTGCRFWNAGEFYGTPECNSMTLLNRYFTENPDDAVKTILCVKGASEPNLMPNGSPDFVAASIETCLKQLGGVAKIDMFECGRRDVKVPLDVTLSTLAKFVDEGKIGGVALTEVNAETIRQATKITKIVAVEVELSLWSRDPLHNGIAETCAELDIPLIAYSPLGKGILTGGLRSANDFKANDLRKMFPRFQAQNFETNLKLVNALEQFSKEKQCTPAQLALGWLCALSERPDMPSIIPIPGTG
ncbi:MAG: Pyridoxine 4-dehydrogenase [Chrysothrix sp. TS-e1954]|nr:MAG: Pyridoxine 4-dehydrogenase [Chrysothrix sp. TS-e1954]